MDLSVKYQEFAVSQRESEKPSAFKTRSNSTYVIIIGVLLVIALLAFVSAVAIGIGVGVSFSTGSESQQPASGLTTITISEEALEGEYHGPNGGIRFKSTVNSTYFVLSITTTSGEPVAFIIHPVVSNMTMVTVNSTNFMVMENQPGRARYDDYLIPDDAMNMMESVIMGQQSMSNEMFQHLDNKTVNETRQSVLNSLANSQEALLVIEAAQAVGDLGIQGSDSEYPAVMRFYLLALRLAITRDSSDEFNSVPETKSFSEHREKRGVSCDSNGATCSSQSRCPSKRGRNKCFGLCGKNCWCWSFVCGDCCVHQYCLSHDQCCKDRGFFTWTCLSVIGNVLISSCTDTYRC